MDIKDIQKHLDKVIEEVNNRGIPEFEGYSPNEMQQIMYFTFEKNSPLKLKKLTDSEYLKIPILNLVKYLAGLIDKAGEIKLTDKGYLPIKIVSELYEQGFIKDKFLDEGSKNYLKELDLQSVHLTRILMEISGLTKKRKGKLSLTKSAAPILADNDALLRLILLNFATRFNWAYFDGFDENQIGQLGYGFTMVLLSKYGDEKRLNTFYAEKYFKAFPQLLESVETRLDNRERTASRCYSIRTFHRFLRYFGLITIEEIGKWTERQVFITKSDLLDSLIACVPKDVRNDGSF